MDRMFLNKSISEDRIGKYWQIKMANIGKKNW